MLEILRREEYLFEDARGLVDGDRVKIGEPEPLIDEPPFGSAMNFSGAIRGQ